VREALRAAVAAFAAPRADVDEGAAQGAPVELASPATPEAIFFAIERVRHG